MRMNAGITLSSDAGARLMREAQAACRLTHPNIVNIFDLVYEADTLFMVMELLHGETLRSFMKRGRRSEPSELVELLFPAFDGVAAAHERGVIHRDLKPDNLFLVRSAGGLSTTIKVLDFGVAKVLDSDSVALTQSGATLGTPLYMSLEQLRGAKDVDQRTDVYAFGVILYEALTGRLPFVAQTLAELAIRLATEHPVRVLQLRPDVPEGLAHAIEHAMMRDRERRLPDVRSLMEALAPYRQRGSLETSVRVLSTTAESCAQDRGEAPTLSASTFASSSVERSASPRPDTRWRWVGLLIAASGAAALLVALSYRQWRSESGAPRHAAPANLVLPRTEQTESAATDPEPEHSMMPSSKARAFGRCLVRLDHKDLGELEGLLVQKVALKRKLLY